MQLRCCFLQSRQQLSASLALADKTRISLYRQILRAHRALPLEMRSLGDEYVKAGMLLYRGRLQSQVRLPRVSETPKGRQPIAHHRILDRVEALPRPAAQGRGQRQLFGKETRPDVD